MGGWVYVCVEWSLGLGLQSVRARVRARARARARARVRARARARARARVVLTRHRHLKATHYRKFVLFYHILMHTMYHALTRKCHKHTIIVLILPPS